MCVCQGLGVGGIMLLAGVVGECMCVGLKTFGLWHVWYVKVLGWGWGRYGVSGRGGR